MESLATPRNSVYPNIDPKSPRPYDALSDLPKPPKNRRAPVKPQTTYLSVVCINCQELIPTEEIELHSSVCTTVDQSVKNIEEATLLEEASFKLTKLENCLKGMSKRTEIKPGDKNYIMILLRLAKKLQEQSKLQTDDVLKSVSSLLVTFKGTLSVRIYADRLEAIASEQKIALEQKLIEEKKLEVQNLSKQVEVFRTKAEVLQRSLLKPNNNLPQLEIDEIKSSLGSARSTYTDLSSKSSLNASRLSEFNDELIKTDTVQNLQTYFYSLCLSEKLKYSSKSPAQFACIKLMYQNATQQSIPVENWTEFIAQELRNPHKWINTSKRRPERKSNFYKPQYFETIIEED